MTAKNLGPTGYLDPTGRNWETVAFNPGKPVLSAELNLQQDVDGGFGQTALKRALPSGWLSPDFLGSSDMASAIFTSSVVANELLIPNDLLAHVNGWLLRVSDTEDNTQNKLALPVSPVGVGAKRTDLVILEVWRRLLSASPSTVGKSPTARIWLNGNVKIAAADDLVLNPADDILDVVLGAESTKRVQIQYRLRVISGVDIFAFPYGIDDPTVVANSVPVVAAAPDGVATAFLYTNQSANGDSGLWRAGDGNPANALGTVDGYIYAIPLEAVFRRNQNAFDKNSNHNGGVATPGPSDRPDGLFFDVIAARDVADLRLGVSPTGWDYREVLDKNFGYLLDNVTRTDWITTLIGGGYSGHTVLWADEIGITNAHGGDGITTGDTPGAEFIGEFDAARRFFTDRANVEIISLAVPMPGGGWVPGASVTIDPSLVFPIYPNSVAGWNGYNPADIVILDVGACRWLGEAPGKFTYEANTYIALVGGLGAMPVGPVTLTLGAVVPAGLTNERLFVNLVVEWPAGHGLTKTPTNSYPVSINNPGQLPAAPPIDYASLVDSFDFPHREVRLQYVTTALTITLMADSAVAGLDTFNLPERANTLTLVLRNALPLVGGVTLGTDGRTVTFTNPLDFTSPGDVLTVSYEALRPLPQNNEQLTIWYEARAPQTARSAILTSPLTVLPRCISESLYTLTVGSGSADESYPFPTGYNQLGGIWPSLVGSFTGEHELSAGAKIYVAEFNASTGFLKLPTFIGYTPSPQAVSFIRGGGDIDIEDRTFFPQVPAVYIPNAYGQPLSDAKRHRNVLPMIAELVSDSPLGYKGQLVLVLFIREADFDKLNGVFFDADPNVNTTVASVFRLKSNLLNKVS
jgi:hypothetical protein